MIVKRISFYICCLILSFTATPTDANTGRGENTKTSKQPNGVRFMKMDGTNYYFPIIDHDLETSATDTGYKYEKPGYSYPQPKKTTQLPPLSEFMPDEDLDKEISDESPDGAFPGKEAELPTRPPAIGLEQEEEGDSTGLRPDPLPPGVNDPPLFELNSDDSTLCTKDCDSKGQIPGIGGVDYPTYPSVPKTNFKCPALSGYYGDTEARCQAFHVCLNTAGRTRQFSFLCPNGTIFSQMDFVCVWWHDFNCHATPSLYHLNKKLGWDDPNVTIEQKMANLMKIAKMSEVLKKQKNISTQRSQIQNAKSTNDVFQSMASFQVSKVANSKKKTESSQLTSQSEAYEDTGIPSGFIVNRYKGRKSTTPSAQVESDARVTPPPMNKAQSLAHQQLNLQTSEDEEESNELAGYYTTTNRPLRKMDTKYLPPKLPSTTTPTYLPPEDDYDSNELPSNQPQVNTYTSTTPLPRKYLPPHPTTTRTQPPPLAYLPPVSNPQLDFNSPEEEDESNELPGGQPNEDYYTTTYRPITRPPSTTIKPLTPKLSYLPPRVYKPQSQKPGYDNDYFKNPAFQVNENEPPGAENQFEPVALFMPNSQPPASRRTKVRELQREILQNSAPPVQPFEPLKPLTFDYPPPPNVLMSRQLPPPSPQLRQRQDSPLQTLLDPVLMGDTIDEPPFRALSFESEQSDSQFNRNPNDFNRNPNDFNRNPNDFNRKPNDFNRNPNDFNRNPNDFNQNANDFNRNPNDFNRNPNDFNQNPNDFNQNPNDFNRNPNNFNRYPIDFNQNPNNFNRNPNNFNRNPNAFNQNPNDFNRNPNKFNQNPNDFNRNPNEFNQNPNDFNRSPNDFNRKQRPIVADQERRQEPIKTLNLINPGPIGADASRNRRPNSKRIPDSQQTNSQLRIVFSTAAPPPTHIPVSYERFQEPNFDPSDPRNQISAILPEDLRYLLLPNVTDPPEVYRAPSIFEQTFISQDTSPKARKPNSVRQPTPVRQRPPVRQLRPQLQPVKSLDLIDSDSATGESEQVSRRRQPRKFNLRPKHHDPKARRPLRNEGPGPGFTINKFLRFY